MAVEDPHGSPSAPTGEAGSAAPDAAPPTSSAAPAGALVAPDGKRRLPLADESMHTWQHPLYETLEHTPGLSLATTSVDQLLTWGLVNSIWIFPMATSCCGIELMAAAASRVDLDRIGTILRGSPRQCDVMVVAGTITVKMAPRVLKLWEQMPEPKWCIAMGSCAISGDFYRELYSVIPGIDTVVPVDVYIPGCPPNPEALMQGILRLKEKVLAQRAGKFAQRELNPTLIQATVPSVARIVDPARDPALSKAQEQLALQVTEIDVSAQLRIEAATVAIEEAELAAAEEHAEAEAEAPVDAAPVAPDAPAADFAALLAELGIHELPKDGPPLVPVDKHLWLAQRLVALGYRSFVFVVASHWPAGRGRPGAVKDEVEHYECAYALRTLGPGSRLATWSVRVNLGEKVPSMVGLLAGADWQEREQYDLVGVEFAGHPDLRRIMLPEGWEGHPLRRDYPADAHIPPWR